MPLPLCVIVMGVSGCGKRCAAVSAGIARDCMADCIYGTTIPPLSTVGDLMAEALQCRFYDADDFHPETNKGAWAAFSHSGSVP